MQENNSFVCNICKGTQYHNFGMRSDQREVIACSACGMGVLKEIPEDTSIFYIGNYYTTNSTEDGYSNYDYTASHSLLWVRHAIQFFPGCKKILDIGAANGFLLSQLDNKYQKYGIEVNKQACSEAESKGINIISSDIYETPSRYEDFFDIITSIATYEHVTDFRKAIESSLRLLKADGILIFEVPIISQTQDSSIWYRTSLEHIYYPTKSGLNELFRILGADLTGFESNVNGFGTTYVGIVTRTLDKKLLADKLIGIITEREISLLSKEDKAINVAFNIVHSFLPTSDGILALPLLIERGINGHVMSRLTQLWHNDFMEAYRLRIASEHAKERENSIKGALARFSVEFKEHMKDDDTELNEIYNLTLPSLCSSSYENYEASEKMVEINRRMLSPLRKYQQLAGIIPALTDKLNTSEQRLSDITNSTSWRATERLRSILTRHPHAARFLRRSLKLLWWMRKGTLVSHLKLYLSHRKTRGVIALGESSPDHESAKFTQAGLYAAGSMPLSSEIHFIPMVSIVLFLSPEGMEHTVASLIKKVPTEWELVIVGSADEWNLSHPLLRYVTTDAPLSSRCGIDDITQKTFGKLVFFVGVEELEQRQMMGLTEHEWGEEIHVEAAKLTQLLSKAEGSNKIMRIQTLWLRPE